ncbi:MAG: reverse transcriptase domain-containing protein [Candidatus Tectomicrobia bacterium]|nr:reverse transcriptase domain-containing protein [Candidatus Tectomicrobia bacterium]
MRSAETILGIIRQCGQRGLPVKDAYRLLYQRDLYLHAYGKIYRNEGAMTPGITPETVDDMSLEKIDTIIEALRYERYRWTPVRRTYVPKKNSKRRPLGLPSWSDKLLQEVIRAILEAYYEPQFSDRSHGFRPKRGCHTALREVVQQGHGTKWFIEGDLCACFDSIDSSMLLSILGKRFHDNRFLRLIGGLLKAGYMEDWKFHATYSGVPQGGIASPILSNIVLDRLDKYVEEQLLPAYTRGRRRKTNPPYVQLTRQAWEARKQGDWERAKSLRQQAQRLPSRDPKDPNFRRLWYCRYADDFLLGFSGPKREATEIKHKIATFLRSELRLKLNDEKTLITHARDDKAKFLGYEVHVLHADDKHDHRRQRCINGSIGLRIPLQVKQEKCAQYMRRGKPIHLPQRTIDDVYSTVAQYQTEYRGLVQYYRLAYNLHTLSHLKHVMEVSLVKTLANKYRTTCRKIYRRFGTTIDIDEGRYKVILIKIDRKPPREPLVAYFGGVSLKYNRWVGANDQPTEPIWSGRSEVVERLLAQECELCRSKEGIAVHHVRKLADLAAKGRQEQPLWKKRMVARRRKTLLVCRRCHETIHYGQYDGEALRRKGDWRAT